VPEVRQVILHPTERVIDRLKREILIVSQNPATGSLQGLDFVVEAHSGRVHDANDGIRRDCYGRKDWHLRHPL
jgi:hypothetical protein